VQAAPATRLRAPFDLRPLMTLWNARSLQTGPSAPDATKSAKWQRGAYLVDGLGHCGACHTPRDAFGAERNRGAYLAGALADGWEAPALGALAAAPVAWTENAMVRYLRDGFDPEHGIAGGAMAPVVRSLAGAAAADIEAIAHYLVSLQRTRPPVEAQAIVAAAARRAPLPDAAQRLFDSACGACHHDGEGPQTEGPNLPLALNVNLHSARPDNLVLTILDGIGRPATPTIGHMPGFRHALSDRQIATLAAWMRRRFAPDATPWPDLESNVARLRGP
jgi:nicotinate dehydrogenase subunit B